MELGNDGMRNAIQTTEKALHILIFVIFVDYHLHYFCTILYYMYSTVQK